MVYFTRRELLVILKGAIVNGVKDKSVRVSLVVGLNKLLLDKSTSDAWIYGNDFLTRDYLRYAFRKVEYDELTDLVEVINGVTQREYDGGYVKYAFAAAVKAAFSGDRAGPPPKQVDCPVDFADVWQVFLAHLQKFPLTEYTDRWAAVFDHFSSFSALRYKHFGPEAALSKDQAARSGVMWALLKSLDAPKYDPILKAWHLSREFIHCIVLIFQRQGYAYGDSSTKKEVAFEMLRVLTRMGNKEPLVDDLSFVGGVFDYPRVGDIERRSVYEKATIGQFYASDLLVLSKNIAAFLSVIPTAALAKSQPPTVALQASIKGEMKNRRAEIDAFNYRVNRSIDKLRPLLEVEYAFSAEEIFNRLFVAKNIGISSARLSTLIRNLMDITDTRDMQSMRDYLDVRSRQWIDDDAYAALFDEIYAYFTSPPALPDVSDMRIIQLRKYLTITVERMRTLPVDELKAIGAFVNNNGTLDGIGVLRARFDSSVRYLLNQDARVMAGFSADQLKAALKLLDTLYDRERTKSETEAFMDDFYYALELKREADPSFDPFSVL
jgi:hypothetical protein